MKLVRLIRRGEKQPLRNKLIKQMLISLVRHYQEYPGYWIEALEIGYNFDGFDLLHLAGILSKEEAYQLQQEWRRGDIFKEIKGISALDIIAIVEEMVMRGWVKWEKRREVRVIIPTSLGIDLAHQLLRPTYRKILDLFKGDIRTIVIAAISGALASIVAGFIMRLLS